MLIRYTYILQNDHHRMLAKHLHHVSLRSVVLLTTFSIQCIKYILPYCTLESQNLFLKLEVCTL